MNLADALAWMVGIGSAINLYRTLRHSRRQALGWIVVHALLVLFALASVAGSRPELAYVALVAWALLVLGPTMAVRRQLELASRSHFEQAARWARVAGLLHPFDGFPAQAKFLLAQGEIYAGRFEQARSLLVPLAETKGVDDLARIELLRLDRNWSGVIEYVEALSPSAQFVLIPQYLRALGERGDTSHLLEVHARIPPLLRASPSVRLFVSAFLGKADLVRELFAGPLAGWARPLHDYWLASVEQVAGDPERARARLEAMRTRGELWRQAEARLAAPLQPVDLSVLSSAALDELAHFEREQREHARVAGSEPRKPVATVLLMAALVFVFVIGRVLPGSKEDSLIRMGALVLPPELIGGGVAWRIVAAGFLHLDATHLGMNLLGLWVIGRPLERTLRPRGFLACFLAASVGAYAIGFFFMPASVENPRVVLGASAGVMGLIGGLAVFSGAGFLIAKNRILGQQLRAMLLIVGLQIVFDAFHPRVSSFLHLAGLACGALSLVPLSLRTFRHRGVRSRS